jgi:NADPH2:quinone reductase
MKAIYFKEHGDLDKLIYSDYPTPKLKPAHALIKVRACALNRLDLWVLQGWPGLSLDLHAGHIGGSDISGEIEQVESSVEHFKVGARVALTPGFIFKGYEDEYTLKGEECLSPKYQIFGETISGGLAEYVLAPLHTLIPMPTHLSFEEAACPLLVATTAWRMLKHRAKLQKGETILVLGASGGLNSLCVLLAKDLGAFVIACSSNQQKIEKLKKLGADEVIDYQTNPEWFKEVKRITNKRGVDVVVDNIGASTFNQSLSAAARGGRIVTVGNTSGYQITLDNRQIFGKQLSILGSTMGNYRDCIDAANWAWAKPLSTLISDTIPLSRGIQAYRKLKEASHFGKIIVNPTA